MDVSHLKVSLSFYFIFFLELTPIFFLPACDIISLYGMSMGHSLLEMVPTLFALKGAKGTISLAQAKDVVPGPNCMLKSLWG